MTVDFRSVALNDTVTKDVILKNAGIEELIINSFSATDAPFELIINVELPIHISPDDSVNIYVKFNPTAEMEFSDTIAISSNSQIGEMEMIVSGDGMALAKARPLICYATTGLNEGGSLLEIDVDFGFGLKIGDLANLRIPG